MDTACRGKWAPETVEDHANSAYRVLVSALCSSHGICASPCILSSAGKV